MHPDAHKFANACKDNSRTEAGRVLGEHKRREIAEQSRWEERDKTDRTKTGKNARGVDSLIFEISLSLAR